MSLLKENESIRKSIIGKFNTILSILDDVDVDNAIQLVDWLMKKSDYTHRIFNNLRFHKYPDDIKRGDIVLVELGMNIFPELSDDGTNYHFALVWGQQGQNFIILPLTKRFQPESNKYAVNLGRISGLPSDVDTFVKIDAIRSVSIRRIHRIKEYENGKITLSDQNTINKINMIFIKNFIF